MSDFDIILDNIKYDNPQLSQMIDVIKSDNEDLVPFLTAVLLLLDKTTNDLNKLTKAMIYISRLNKKSKQ